MNMEKTVNIRLNEVYRYLVPFATITNHLWIITYMQNDQTSNLKNKY